MRRRQNGEGSIYKRKNGRWAALASVTLANGEPKRVYVTAKTYEEVKIKLRELLDHEAHQIPYIDKNYTIAEYLDYWMREVQFSRIRESSYAAYDVLIRHHINPAMGSYNLQQFSIQNARSGVVVMREHGCSNRTILESLRLMSSCFNNAMREEILQRNVIQLIEKPKRDSKETAIWTADQATQFLRTAEVHPQYIAFLLFLTYGLRRGEVLGLRWSDIDFANGLVHIRQQICRINGKLKALDLKTANSRRTLPLTAKVRAALMEHARKNNVTLPQFNLQPELTTQGAVIISKVGTPLEPRRLARYFDVLTKQAGLPHIKIHAMRHTAATLLKDLGVPVKDAQLILGHSDIATTLSIYQHGTPENQRAAILAVEERLASSSNFVATATKASSNGVHNQTPLQGCYTI